MQLFFEKKELKENKLALTVDRYHYLSRVKRVQKGETLAIIIQQTQYTIKVSKIDSQYLYFNTLAKKELTPQKLNISLIQCLPKHTKMDPIIDQATQLGVSHIYPIESERSIVKWTQTKKEKQLQRWKAISQQACQQSQQNTYPTIAPIESLQLFCNSFTANDYNLCIVPWEAETKYSLKAHLTKIKPKKNYKIALFIGPEGGISNTEITQLKTLNFSPISLGTHIYRTEIAGVITLSQIIYALS